MLRFGAAACLVALVATFGTSKPASAHNVWCHCNFSDPRETLEFFHLAGEVYTAHAQAIRLWHDSNVPLETGVLVEFEHKADRSKPLKPELFRDHLGQLQKLEAQLLALDKTLGAVIDFLGKHDAIPEFDAMLLRVTSSTPDIKRLSSLGTRYAEVAGARQAAKEPQSLGTVLAIYKAQREDLGMLRAKLAEVVAGARDAVPLAEKGEFAQVMLSGRNAFGDKMPQFTDWFSAYDRFYVQSCMATIAVTMQIYPKGFEWLTR
jgi:hypothetical protein